MWAELALWGLARRSGEPCLSPFGKKEGLGVFRVRGFRKSCRGNRESLGFGVLERERGNEEKVGSLWILLTPQKVRSFFSCYFYIGFIDKLCVMWGPTHLGP